MVRFFGARSYESTNVQERRHHEKTKEGCIFLRTRQGLTTGLERSHPIPLGGRFWKLSQWDEEGAEFIHVWKAEDQGRRDEGHKGGAGIEESADECKVVEILGDAGDLVTRIRQLLWSRLDAGQRL